MQSELRLYYAASIVWPEALMFLPIYVEKYCIARV